MDFFERQEQARRRTGLLVACYAAAVGLTISAVYAVLVAVLRGDDGIEWWQAELFVGVALILGLLILGGSLFKMSALAAGGAKVAGMLGGRELSPETTDPDERRLLNVVEEMAIASGITPPPVFVLDDEEGINAFAAGLRPADAVIGVTSGCLRQLTRDELQGVVAHEFSHILNGDMRLNIRLIGVLHGLLMIHLLGLIMLRSMMFSGAGRSRRRSSSSGRGGDGRAAIVIFVLGLAMMIIGAIGVLFGRLIKSAVSRQREHLADAAAVQFTRNPTGLAGALKKIGGLSTGSRVRDPHAEELSHLFFANGLSSAWLGLMATHPPLKERIRRLDPAYAPTDASTVATAPRRAATPSTDNASALTMGLAGDVTARQSDSPASTATTSPCELAMQPAELTDSIGTLTAGQLDAAQSLLAALPAAMRERLHHPDAAVAAVLALLSSDQSEVAKAQAKTLDAMGDDVRSAVAAMKTALDGLNSSVRLAVVDLALPALQRMTPEAYRRFRKACLEMVAADGQLSVFEYAMLGIIERHLTVRFDAVRPPAIKYHALKPLMPDAITILGVLAHFGNPSDTETATRVFTAGLKTLDPASATGLPDPTACSLTAFDRALTRVRHASMPIRKRLLQAGAVCVAANGRVNVDEGNLLRTIADACEAPMPPLVASS